MTTIAYAFPGQGSQELGMGSDFYSSPLCKRAAEICGFDLVTVMKDGPMERLSGTDASQPALFLHSALVMEAMKGAGLHEEPAFYFGLSLGEYTALYSAGALSFDDAVKALSVRGRAMQEACRASVGGMASVLGLEDAAVEKACDEARDGDVLQAANYNCPGQVVISGHKKAIERAEPILKAAGAKRILPLKVAGAFHSPLMEPAIEPLRACLAKIRFLADPGRVISNVSAAPHSGPELGKALLSQLTSPVMLSQSLRYLCEERGVSLIREIGAGKVICGLARRSAPQCASGSFSSKAELESLVKQP